MRLDKFLSDCGIGTRTEVKQFIKSKKICVNHQVITSAKYQLDEKNDCVSFMGDPITYEKFVYYMLNKPKGIISATEDELHTTVLDILDEIAKQKEVFPVGRLDIDTHGLLLLTNNGQLAHALLSPKKHVTKVYQACVKGIMTQKDIELFANGVVLADGTVCLPAKLFIDSVNELENTSQITLEIEEGKFHQVKRMVLACGKKVEDLRRIKMGPLELDSQLKKGEFRRLTLEELETLSQYGVEI